MNEEIPTVTRSLEEDTWQPAKPPPEPSSPGADSEAAGSGNGSSNGNGNGNRNGSAPGEGVNARPRAGARARGLLSRTVSGLAAAPGRAAARRRSGYTEEEREAPEIHRADAWRDGLPSIQDVIAYTKSGAMMPGAQNMLRELWGKLWGYCFLVPLVAAFTVVFNLLCTPQRAKITVGVVTLAVSPAIIHALVML